jgi:hypothetical protein
VPAPHLVDASESTPLADRYSYVFDGSAQTLDHVLFTQNLQPYFARVEHARVNADFPEVLRNDPARPERLSDHDPAVAYFRLTPDAGIAMAARTSPVAGQPLTYTINVRSGGTVSFTLPPELIFDSMIAQSATAYALNVLVRRDVPNGAPLTVSATAGGRTAASTTIVATPVEGRPVTDRCCRVLPRPGERSPRR